jgi:hypothetical protein
MIGRPRLCRHAAATAYAHVNAGAAGDGMADGDDRTFGDESNIDASLR